MLEAAAAAAATITATVAEAAVRGARRRQRRAQALLGFAQRRGEVRALREYYLQFAVRELPALLLQIVGVPVDGARQC